MQKHLMVVIDDMAIRNRDIFIILSSLQSGLKFIFFWGLYLCSI